MELSASSLSRIIEWGNRCDTGTISACRGLDTEYFQIKKKDPSLWKKISYVMNTNEAKLTNNQIIFKKQILKKYGRRRAVNEYNTKKLERRLLALGYMLIELTGYYKEEGMDKPTKEKSYFVINYLQWRASQGEKVKVPDLFEDLVETGFVFEQDSFTFARKGKDYALYNCSPYSSLPLGTKIAVFKGKGGFADVANEYAYSRIGSKPFGWKNFTIASAEYKGCPWIDKYAGSYFKAYKLVQAKSFVGSNNANYQADSMDL